MAEITHLDSDTTEDQVIHLLKRDAAVILDDQLDSQFLSKLRMELEPFLSSDAFGRDEFTGFQTKRIGALIARSKACRELAVHPLINKIAKTYLSDYASGYQLHFSSAVCIGPGETKQILHRDRGIWGGYLPRKIEPLIGTIWALDEFTNENGATQVVPGSHVWDKTRSPTEDEIASAEMQAGSVLLYTGTVLHGGGANSSSSNRTGIFLHYALNWLRQEENQYLSCPPMIARELSPELRSLIGYSKGGYVLGFYSDPADREAKYESVSPENIFRSGDDIDKYGSLPTPRSLVEDSS